MFGPVCSVLLSCLVLASAFPVFRDCGSQTGVLKELSIESCTTPICTLHKKRNETINVVFHSNNVVNGGKVVVHGILSYVPVPFALDDDNLCHFVSPTCPLRPTEDTYKYSFSLPIKDSYPSVRLKIKWELVDENGKDIVCALFPVEIS
ncbi:unnamed protein product [Calicophoron daubneyi]|uniref:MD-2-related lipid-recognition domain-containing protein n=1 Tax=Calicophoron daubneyi TaxID=300641 RepID=A0AAV2TM59_CALDB